MLVKYIRNKKGEPVGCVVAWRTDGDVKIGWSLCHKDDKFDKKDARLRAMNRGVYVWEKDKIFVPCPLSMHKEMKKMLHRVDRYYKDIKKRSESNHTHIIPQYSFKDEVKQDFSNLKTAPCEPEDLDDIFVPDLNKFCEYCHAKSKGWWDEPRSDLECLALVVSEIGEAIEELRKGNSMGTAYHSFYVMSVGKPEGPAAGIADVFIRLADLLGRYGLDFEDIVRQKIQFNLVRPYRHGNKKY